VKNGAKFPRSSDCNEVIVDANSETKKKKGGFSEETSFLKVVICLGPVPAGRVTLNGISLGTSRKPVEDIQTTIKILIYVIIILTFADLPFPWTS